MSSQLDALGGDVEHHHEDAEQQQRAAEVALEDQHRGSTAPRPPAPGPRSRPRGSSRPGHPAAGQRQHVALVDQVGGEEDDQADLRELAGLDGEAGQPDPDLGAVDLRQRRRAAAPAAPAAPGRPARACRRSGTATRWSRTTTQDGDEQRDAERRPDQLDRARPRGWPCRRAARRRGRAGGSPSARGRRAGDGGQQQRVGVGRPLADDEVRDHPQRGDPGAEARPAPGAASR